ncbi:MAG: helix-hairpin-helix domain-containing protein [Myxococcales bacterium]|nr:helix-hairpin-helix domain-containing protein [Myxococcales bacterium]USN50442.1 MAG: helix-hairpin-helix domain-containing protein [Myxococcales bacterium]
MKKIIPFLFFVLKLEAFQAVDLNQASASQIALLPGIGSHLAHSIVKYRQQKSIETPSELLKISGMSEKKLARIKNHIVFLVHKKISDKNPKKKRVQQPEYSHPKKIIDLFLLEKKVLKQAGLEKEYEHSLAKRARLSAWIPRITFRGDINEHDVSTKKYDANSERFGNIFGIGVRAQFDLPSVLFNESELDIAKLALKRLEKREILLTQLHDYYFAYIHLDRKMQNSFDSEESRVGNDRLQELSARLDSLSGGEFSRFQKENP